jgi:subtilisin family serine protease
MPSVRRIFSTPQALALGILTAATAASSLRAQQPASKLDPLLRPLLDPAVVARIESAPRPGAAGMMEAGAARAALQRPLSDVVVLRREPGQPETLVDVFVSLDERSPAAIEAVGGRVTARAGALFGARLPLSALGALQADGRVRYIQAAHRIPPTNDLAMQDIRASLVRTFNGGVFTGATGSGVIVGVFDTGIDWSHGDFKNADGTTRILYIWDLTVAGTPPGTIGGQTFSTGNECSAAVIDAGSCSERDIAGHGSHVSGTASGNGAGGNQHQYAGVAPNADIIMVKGGDFGFSSLDIITGIQYIFKRAEARGSPAVVNLSLGTVFGPHDGTAAEEQAIDSLSGPGHIVVIAAGNSGSNATATTGNTPVRLIHATHTFTVVGDSTRLSVSVPTYTPSGSAFNDFMLFTLWYDRRDSITVTVRRPDGTSLSRRTGDVPGDTDGVQGHIFLDNASAGPAAQNGDDQGEIEMYDANAAQPPAAGTWVISIRLDHLGGSGRFDVWQYAASQTLAGSQFTVGGDNAYLVSTPGTAARALTVAAYVTRVAWVSVAGQFEYLVREQLGDLATFSSSGPTRPVRDSLPSRQKPDLAAPGKGIFSVYSSASSPPAPGALIATDGTHVLFAGTSMATPMVTGTVALLLERRPQLTPEQVAPFLTGSARQDAFTAVSWAGFGGGSPNPSWGYGKLDVQAALALVPAALTVAPGANSPAGKSAAIGANAALQFGVTAWATEGERLDTISLAATSNHALSDIVTELDLYRDSTEAGVIPAGPPFIALPAPFAGGTTLHLTGLATNLAPGGSFTYLLAVRLNDHLRQGDTVGVRVTGVAGTGAVSAQRAVGYFPAPVASRLARASLLQGNEVFLVSENPVRSGRVIFSYATPPRSVALYNFAGLRVRAFTALPTNSFTWDVRGESPGLPNGMYILVVDTGTQLVRQRLMILSPAR